jgi:acyl-CoA thioesterase
VTRFDRDTAVAPLGAGRYGARMDTAWWIQRGPNGGYVAATIVRAMEAELAAAAGPGGVGSRQLRSLTVHYLAAPPEGDVEIAVTIERAGRSLSTLSARMSDGERTLALALAAFASPYPGADAYELARPPAEAPDEMPPAPTDAPMAFARNFRMLPVLGEWPFSSGEEPSTGGWMQLAEDRPLDAALVVALSDAWFPAPFTRLDAPTAAPTIDLTVHVRAALPLDNQPVLGEFSSSTLRDGFFEEDGTMFTADGTLLAQSRQLALLLPAR